MDLGSWNVERGPVPSGSLCLAVRIRIAPRPTTALSTFHWRERLFLSTTPWCPEATINEAAAHRPSPHAAWRAPKRQAKTAPRPTRRTLIGPPRRTKRAQGGGQIKRARLVTALARSSPTRHLSVISPIAHLSDSEAAAKELPHEKKSSPQEREPHAASRRPSRLSPFIATRAASLFFPPPFLPSIFSPLLFCVVVLSVAPSLCPKGRKKKIGRPRHGGKSISPTQTR